MKIQYGVVVDGKVVYKSFNLKKAQLIASTKQIDESGKAHDVYIIDRKVKD